MIFLSHLFILYFLLYSWPSSPGNVYASSGDCVKRRSVEVDLPQLRPGVYMVVCATFAAGQLGPFQLSAFVNSTAASLEQFYPPTWRTIQSGGAGGSGEGGEGNTEEQGEEGSKEAQLVGQD